MLYNKQIKRNFCPCEINEIIWGIWDLNLLENGFDL